jgi:hypothetical protein
MSLVSLACLLGSVSGSPCLAAGRWRAARPEGEKKSLPRGKTLGRYPSPNRSYVLLLRDEGEHGDFFWRSLYLQHGKAYTHLQNCNELRRVRWSTGSSVRYQTDTAVDADKMDREEVVYTPSTRTLRKRLIRTLKVQGAG